MKQIHPSSKIKISTLPPELAQIRQETRRVYKRKEPDVGNSIFKHDNYNLLIMFFSS